MKIEEKIKYSFEYGKSYLLSAKKLESIELGDIKWPMPDSLKRAFYYNEEYIVIKEGPSKPPYIFLYVHGVELYFKGLCYWGASILPQEQQNIFLKKIQNTHCLDEINNIFNEIIKEEKFIEDCHYIPDEEELLCLAVIKGFNESSLLQGKFSRLEQLSRFGFLRDGKIFDENKVDASFGCFFAKNDKYSLILFTIVFFELFLSKIQE